MYNCESEKFKENIQKLLQCSNKLILISQNRNLEEEIVTSTNIRTIVDFYNIHDLGEYKTKFKSDRNLNSKLENKDFDFNLLWSSKIMKKEIVGSKISHDKKEISQ